MSRSAAAANQTKAEEALTVIRQRIESGQLQGGDRLTLQTMSEELGMSLTPVREALRLLEASGLVEYRRRQGHFVTRYSISRAKEVYTLRKLLEPLATELAAQNADAEEFDRIDTLNRQFSVSASIGTAAVVELNSRWHRAIYDAAHTPLLQEFIERLWTGVPYQAMWFVPRSQNSASDHDAITAAILRRDGDEASAAMLQHIREGEAATLDHLKLIGAPWD